MEEVISNFAKVTGKTAEEGIKIMAKSACRRLALTVQPYGLKGEKLDKFIASIGIQVDRVWFGVNIGAFPASSSIKDSHYAARRNGSVPKRLFRKEKGKPWLDLIPRSESDAYKKTAQAKAFRAKAAWVRVADDIGKPKMSGISNAIRRHVSSAMGSFHTSGEGMNAKVTIENNVHYISQIQYAEDVAKATADGLKNGLKYMQKVTDKEIEKANRAIQ
jgi:hypothetical protein